MNRTKRLLAACFLIVGIVTLTTQGDAEPSRSTVQAQPLSIYGGPTSDWHRTYVVAITSPAALEFYRVAGEQEAARVAAAARPKPVAKTNHRRNESVEACIARVENHGDYGRSSNPTHFGKYQYDRQTWEAHGGDPSTWGTATPEEQEAVFANGTAKYGYGAWTRWDGCG